jgi:hypothetical protein
MGIVTSFCKAWFGGVEYRVIVIGSNKKAIKQFLSEVVHSSMPIEFKHNQVPKGYGNVDMCMFS